MTRLSFGLIALSAVFLQPAQTTFAGEFPALDVNEYCRATTAAFGAQYEKMMRDNCMLLEASQRDRLRKVWARVPEASQKKCIGQMEAVKGGSYLLLVGCVTLDVAQRWIETGGRCEAVP